MKIVIETINTTIMTRYNKSRIMKEANRLMKVEGYSRSIALTLAWSQARRSEYYQVIEVRKPRNIQRATMSYESANSYYANRAYSGD